MIRKVILVALCLIVCTLALPAPPKGQGAKDLQAESSFGIGYAVPYSYGVGYPYYGYYGYGYGYPAYYPGYYGYSSYPAYYI